MRRQTKTPPDFGSGAFFCWNQPFTCVGRCRGGYDVGRNDNRVALEQLIWFVQWEHKSVGEGTFF